MKSALWKLRWTLALPAFLLFASTASAQRQQDQQNQSDQAGQTGSTSTNRQAMMPISGGSMMINMDQDVAEWLHIENHSEVAMAKLAETKVQNQAVRQFAQHMIHDHSQFLGELQPFGLSGIRPAAMPASTGTPTVESARPEGPIDAGRASIAGTPNTPAAPGTAGTPVRAPDIGSVPTPGSVANSSTVPTPGGLSVPGTNPTPSAVATAPAPPSQAPQAPQLTAPSRQFASPGPSQGFDFLHAKRQIAAECLTDMTKEFSSMPQAEIDKAYIGQQIVAHENYIDTSKVLRRYASPQLQQVISKGIETAQSHLNEAKEIMRQLTEANYSEGRSATSAK